MPSSSAIRLEPAMLARRMAVQPPCTSALAREAAAASQV